MSHQTLSATVTPLEAAAARSWSFGSVARRIALALIVAWLPFMMFTAGKRLNMDESVEASSSRA